MSKKESLKGVVFKVSKGKIIEKKAEPQNYTLQYNLSYKPTHKNILGTANVQEKHISTTTLSFTFSSTKTGKALEEYKNKLIVKNYEEFFKKGEDDYNWTKAEKMALQNDIMTPITKKELKKIKLGHLSYSYPYLKEADILFKNDNNCIVNYLWYELKDKPYFKKLTKETLETYFKDDKTFLQIEKFVMEYGHISMVALNPLNTVFHKYQAEESKITLTFMINNKHIYPILNSDIKKSINKKGYIDLNEYIYNIDYEDHLFIENNKEEINKETKVLLFEQDNLYNEAVKIMKETNTIIERILYDDCNRIISFQHPITKQIYEITKNYKDRTELIKNIEEVHDLKLNFFNQPISQISKELFNCKYGNLNMTKSFLNNDIYDAFNTYSISPYIAKLNEDFDISVMDAMDISKSYSSALLNNTFDYPVYSIFDTIEPFDGNLTTGEYYINIEIHLCNNTVNLPIGFYPLHFIYYALEKGAITKENILYQIKPKAVIKHDYFKKYVEDCYNNLPNGKELINHLIGTFGKKQTNNISGFISNDWDTICSMYYQEIEQNKEVSIHTFEGLYFFRSIKHNKLLNTSLPVYRHIITHGIINLCNLYYDLNPKYVISYNTDCIVYVRDYKLKDINDKSNLHNEIKDIPNHINNNIIKSELDKVGKYRPEEPKPRGILNKKIIRDDFIFNEKKDLNIYDETKDILSLDSAVVQGIAGAGKSHLIKNIVENKNKDEETNILILCFTNVAVQNLKNRLPEYKDIYTFDTFYNENLSTREKINHTKKYDIVIIDEYSMTPLKHMTLLYNIKNVIPDIKYYFFGDKNQCLGVNEYSHSYDFIETKPFQEMVNYNCYECKYKAQYSRYDEKTFNALNTFLENGTLEDFEDKKNNHKLFINLCKYNDTRKRINEERFKIHSKGKKKYITENENIIYIDMPIICVKTNKYDKIFNSERFTIKNINKEDETITLDNDKEISFLTYDNFFDMAFCFTVYKIQGATINEPYNIYDINTMSKRELYTALSRTTKYEYIHFKKPEDKIYMNNSISNNFKVIEPEPLGVHNASHEIAKQIKETNINIDKLNEKIELPEIKEYKEYLQLTYKGKNYKVRHIKNGIEEAYKKMYEKRDLLMSAF